jgi:hypothetical protein
LSLALRFLPRRFLPLRGSKSSSSSSPPSAYKTCTAYSQIVNS